MGIDFLIDDYPLYGICALIDGLAQLLSPRALRIIQLLPPDLDPAAARFSGIPADLSTTYQYRPLGRATRDIAFTRRLPSALQSIVVVDGRVLKKTAQHPAVREQLNRVIDRNARRLWIIYDDRDFGQVLHETFDGGIPFRLYLKRERIFPKALHVLRRRGVQFMYLSYAVCREHFEPCDEQLERTGVFFNGETAAPFYQTRRQFIQALQSCAAIAPQLIIPEQRQTASDYLKALRSSLVGLDLPAGGTITPRRYEVPASGALLITVNRADWLPDDLGSAGKVVQTTRTAQDLCRAVEAALADREICRRRGQEGRAWVLRHHTTCQRAAALVRKIESDLGVKVAGA